MSAQPDNKTPIEIEGDLIDLLARVYAAGMGSGVASGVATGAAAQGQDPADEKIDATMKFLAAHTRQHFLDTFENDPILREELLTEWRTYAAVVALGPNAGGCSCQH